VGNKINWPSNWKLIIGIFNNLTQWRSWWKILYNFLFTSPDFDHILSDIELSEFLRIQWSYWNVIFNIRFVNLIVAKTIGKQFIISCLWLHIVRSSDSNYWLYNRIQYSLVTRKLFDYNWGFQSKFPLHCLNRGFRSHQCLTVFDNWILAILTITWKFLFYKLWCKYHSWGNIYELIENFNFRNSTLRIGRITKRRKQTSRILRSFNIGSRCHRLRLLK
jgi:hypothetical protein